MEKRERKGSNNTNYGKYTSSDLFMKTKHTILLILFLLGLTGSAIRPHDYFTWILEVFPAILGCFILMVTFKKFQFTYLTYCMILLHCYILFIGGHYTYAEVPLFDWVKETFHQSRNNYDKVGHFAQGFAPAFIIKELFNRKKIVKPGSWLQVLTVCTCATISVFYEFLEWLVAILSGESSDSFLGTQGYVWDTQSDMLYACIGATCTVILFAEIQKRAIAKL
jgi:putative membrane protein